jgi:ribonuclease D
MDSMMSSIRRDKHISIDRSSSSVIFTLAPAKAAIADEDEAPSKKSGKAVKGKKARAKGKTKYDDSDSEDEAPPPPKAAAKKGKGAKHQELEEETEKEAKTQSATEVIEKRVPLKSLLLEGADVVEGQETESAAGWEATLLIDPSQFRLMNELLQRECKGRGRIDVEVGGVVSGGTN